MGAVSSYAYNKRWRYERDRGLTRIIDASAVAEHVRNLLAVEGCSVRGVAEAAAVSPSVVSRLATGQQQRLKRDIAAKLLRVRPEQVATRANRLGFVPKLGAVRRIQALLAIGHRHQDITAAMLRGNPCGTRSQMVLHQAGDWIPRATRDAVLAAYAELSMLPGQSDKTRRLAAKMGYAPPLAWDDTDIDRPSGRPSPGDEAGGSAQLDEIAVQRIMAGALRAEPIAGRGGPLPPELVEAVRRLADHGLTDLQIGERIGRSKDAVLKIRHRNGIATAVPSGRTA